MQHGIMCGAYHNEEACSKWKTFLLHGSVELGLCNFEVGCVLMCL